MLLNAVRTNSLPDMFYSWGNKRLEELVKLDVVADITDTVRLQLENQIYKETIKEYTFNERIYGLPSFGWDSVLYCNTELFAACGVEVPTTYEEFIDAIKVFKSKGITPLIIGGNEAWMSSLYFMELALEYENISIIRGLSEHPKYLSMDGFKEAAEAFERLIDLEPWQEGYETTTSMAATTEFIKGNGAMFLTGSWTSVEIDDIIHSLVKGKIKAIRFPRKYNNEVGIAGYADGFALNKHTAFKEVDAQRLFVQLMKSVSDRAVIGKGLGTPIYKDQTLDNTKYQLLKQCQEIFPEQEYHETYSQMLDYTVLINYHEAFLKFIKEDIDATTFIKEMITDKHLADDQ